MFFISPMEFIILRSVSSITVGRVVAYLIPSLIAFVLLKGCCFTAESA